MGSHVVMVVMVVVVRDIGAGRVCVSEHVMMVVCDIGACGNSGGT